MRIYRSKEAGRETTVVVEVISPLRAFLRQENTGEILATFDTTDPDWEDQFYRNSSVAHFLTAAFVELITHPERLEESVLLGSSLREGAVDPISKLNAAFFVLLKDLAEGKRDEIVI